MKKVLVVIGLVLGIGLMPAVGYAISNLLEEDNKTKTNLPPTNRKEPLATVRDALFTALEEIKEGYREKGLQIPPADVLMGDIAAYFRVPVVVIELVGEYLDVGRLNLLRVSLLVTTKNPVSENDLEALEKAGYEIRGAFGRFVQVKASFDTLISSKTGLQTFDFVLHSDTPPKAIPHR